MRSVIVCLLAAACSPMETGINSIVEMDGDGPLSPTVTVEVEPHGIHVGDEAPWSAAGMGGEVTCQIDPSNGEITVDIDVLGTEEVVDGEDLDGGEAPGDGATDQPDVGGGEVLVCDGARSCRTAHFPSGELGEQWTVAPGGTSRFLARGHVDRGLRGDRCEVVFPSGSTTVSPSACDADRPFEATAEAAWIGGRSALVRVTPQGWATYDVPSTILATDRATGLVLAGDVGSDEVIALDDTGAQRWRQAFGAPVAGLDVHDGVAVIALDLGDYSSELLVVDGATGAVNARQTARNVLPTDVHVGGAYVAVTREYGFEFLAFDRP